MVLILAGELLKKAEHLLVMGLHPSEIIKGYELASTKGLEELENLSKTSLPSPLTQDSLAKALKPAIASKQYGYEDTLASLVADAAMVVMPPNPKNFNVDNVRVVKIMGSSLSGSRVPMGSALEVIPRRLAENALGGAEGNEIVSRLWAKHESEGGEAWGVDVEAETDSTLLASEHEIFDSLAAKSWAIRLATEAATSVLSVDSIIMSKPTGGPKIPQQAGSWDEDD
ncbi:chaperonin Cpn60/TCP-1 [Obba rivulosa]|uniref:Chaperonin Cpn60/TCP-1 n=1 Tax=Obba rivulosa TaxID=1052685 RepID=A0A8E2DIP1_9APHY|nr:chaperonin Cpn60/TCP-1 [Obba rivulosa]